MRRPLETMCVWLLTTIGYRSSVTATRHDNSNSVLFFFDQRLDQIPLDAQVAFCSLLLLEKIRPQLSPNGEIKLTRKPFSVQLKSTIYALGSTFLYISCMLKVESGRKKILVQLFLMFIIMVKIVLSN